MMVKPMMILRLRTSRVRVRGLGLFKDAFFFTAFDMCNRMECRLSSCLEGPSSISRPDLRRKGIQDLMSDRRWCFEKYINKYHIN